MLVLGGVGWTRLEQATQDERNACASSHTNRALGKIRWSTTKRETVIGPRRPYLAPKPIGVALRGPAVGGIGGPVLRHITLGLPARDEMKWLTIIISSKCTSGQPGRATAADDISISIARTAGWMLSCIFRPPVVVHDKRPASDLAQGSPTGRKGLSLRLRVVALAVTERAQLRTLFEPLRPILQCSKSEPGCGADMNRQSEAEMDA